MCVDAQTSEAEPTAETWEAADDKQLCTGVTASDNIDGNLASTLQYNIQKLDDITNEPESGYLCENQDYATYTAFRADGSKGHTPCAARELATTNKGKFLVTWHVCDSAGVYGHNARNNCFELRKVIEIRDTLPPWIQVHGYEPTVKECHHADKDSSKCGGFNPDTGKWEAAVPVPGDCHMYIDAGATASDLLDTEALHKDISQECAQDQRQGCMRDESNVDSSSTGTYSVDYTAFDEQGLKATAKRTVIVEDTTPPVAKLVSPELNPIVHYSRTADKINTGALDWQKKIELANANGATCSDDCDTGIAKPTLSWDRTVNDKVLGDYILTYTCQDAAGLKHSVSRTYTIEDPHKPIIKVQGEGKLVKEASRLEKDEYVDQGATCTDNVNDDLSHSVEVSGQVVNMRIPGTYTITYNCQDLSGNEAKAKSRTVEVRDTTCPTIKLNGDQQTVYVESGFEYVDAGATAYDSLDDDITSRITTEENTVNSWRAFTEFRSCKQIKAAYAKATSGKYWITTSAKKQVVTCDMDTKDDKGNFVAATYKGCYSGCKVIVPYGSEQGTCTDYGMQMINWDDLPKAARTWAEHPRHFGYPAFRGFPEADETSDQYLCGVDTSAPVPAVVPTIGTLDKAIDGTFKISYHVSDKAGNTETYNQDNVLCKAGIWGSPIRTVIVKDTLPPVITLHMATKGVVHTSKAYRSKVGSDEAYSPGIVRDNPAAMPKNSNGFGNQFLKSSYVAAPVTQNKFMAEQSSAANGWVIGALASAVSGLALLGYSMRRSAAVTSVEV